MTFTHGQFDEIIQTLSKARRRVQQECYQNVQVEIMGNFLTM